VVNVTINQIIKILIFICHQTKKYWKSVEELVVLLLRRLEITNLLKQFLLKFLGSKEAMSSSTSRTFKVR
jgi:hypothetical protein